MFQLKLCCETVLAINITSNSVSSVADILPESQRFSTNIVEQLRAGRPRKEVYSLSYHVDGPCEVFYWFRVVFGEEAKRDSDTVDK